MGLLSRRALNGLKSYKYKSGGYTALDKLHQPLWNFVVDQLPLWLAPNLITLAGTLALVVAYFVSMFYLPNFQGEAPRWVYLLSAVCVQLYVHLDCIDGKQARRTKTSSPLGQLFDHGCDALSVHLLLANIASTMGVPCGWIAAAGTFGIMFPWMLAQWEEYHTGVMMYGTDYFGVLEANYGITALHTFTFLFGPAFWGVPLRNIVHIPGLDLKDWAVKDAALLLVFLASMQQASGYLYRTFTFDKTQLPEEERGSKELGPTAAARHLLAICAMLALGGAWMSQPCRGWAHCRAVSGSWGIVFALVASQLIVAHMCKEPFGPSLWPYLVLAVGVVNEVMGFVDPYLADFALVTAILASYLYYVTCIVNEICADLGVRCFHIPVASKEIKKE